MLRFTSWPLVRNTKKKKKETNIEDWLFIVSNDG